MAAGHSPSAGAGRGSRGDEVAGEVIDVPTSDLGPVVEAIAGEAVASFTVSVEPELQRSRGWNALIVIPTFNFDARSGRSGVARCCVKRFLRPGPGEAAHYAYLAAHGFPVPRLYGASAGSGGEEILFLELLDRVANADTGDVEDRLRVLTLHARLLGVPVSDAHAAILADPARNRAAGWWRRLVDGTVERSLLRMWDVAAAGDLGQELWELCEAARDRVPRLVARLPALAERIERMPRALTNDEMGIGLRHATGEILAFDWHGLQLGPRFGPVAHRLGTPEGVRNGWGAPYLPRRFYAEHFAREVARWRHDPVSPEQVLEETTVLWEAAQLVHQGWWVERSLRGDTIVSGVATTDAQPDEKAVEETRQGCRQDLLSVFRYLLRRLPAA